MISQKKTPSSRLRGVQKAPTGISGLDEVLEGGLPRGRSSLICGTAGCGKTLFGLEFLIRGATQFNEPGVFMAFEENENELVQNVASLGFDLGDLQARKKVVLDHVQIERSEIQETGQYDLEGLFVRLGYAIDSIGAKRVVLDTVEALFASLPNEGILRAELRRLFRWLKDKKVTAIITGERGEGTLTRHGLEEYVADCVILLDHRVINQISTRRLRVVKYRGTFHGTNEYPFLIGKDGVSVLPITSMRLDHPAPTHRVSTGVAQLDEMLSGKGYFRGSSILISGTAGTGKTSLAVAFLDAACRRGEKSLCFAFEESRDQIIRNAASIGIHLTRWLKNGLLRFHNVRPNHFGLEMHLLAIHDLIQEIKPRNVVIDPVSNLTNAGEQLEVRSMLTRLIDFLKTEQITTVFTSLTSSERSAEQTDVGVSSLMDAWILLRNIEAAGERNRALYVLKARGMPHSNRVREFVLSGKGIELLHVYTHSGAVLIGAARRDQQAKDNFETPAQHRRHSGFASRTRAQIKPYQRPNGQSSSGRKSRSKRVQNENQA